MQPKKELIPRKLIESIKTKLFRDKAIIVYGPRQVGKTTLVNSIISGLEIDNSSLHEKTAYVNGDDSDVREILTQKIH